jgi:hypothetical protein
VKEVADGHADLIMWSMQTNHCSDGHATAAQCCVYCCSITLQNDGCRQQQGRLVFEPLLALTRCCNTEQCRAARHAVQDVALLLLWGHNMICNIPA